MKLLASLVRSPRLGGRASPDNTTYEATSTISHMYHYEGTGTVKEDADLLQCNPGTAPKLAAAVPNTDDL